MKKWRAIGAAVTLTLMLAACSGEEKEKETEKGDITVTEELLEKESSVTDSTYADTLLGLLAKEHWKGDEERVKEKMEQMRSTYEVLPEDVFTEEDLRDNAILRLFLEDMALEKEGITLKDIEKEIAEGTGVQEVLHAVVLNAPEGQTAEQYAEQLGKEIAALEDFNTLPELLEKHKQYATFGVEYFGKHNVLPGFEDIKEVAEGDVKVFGNATNASVMYVAAIIKDLKVTDYTSIYATNFLSTFSTAEEVLQFWKEQTGKTYKFEGDATFLNATPEKALEFMDAQMSSANIENTEESTDATDATDATAATDAEAVTGAE